MQKSPAQKNIQHWDIFCAVVDNYGDIGVTWRLAKQLAYEYKIDVKLWVDDLNCFSHILPKLNPKLIQQEFNGVTINHWNRNNFTLSPQWLPGRVLIEAFACQLPKSVLSYLELHKPSLCWINLEYLTAEDWVESCHGLPSREVGLEKFFFFPGFTNKTGGILCEKNLFQQRQAWQDDPQNRRQLFHQFSINNAELSDTFISLFCYENEALNSLLNLWQHAANPVHLLVPTGKALHSISRYLNIAHSQQVIGNTIEFNQLKVHILPMTDQETFDRLLWSCDFNIVRGEDSFIRAQWAAKPFIWHIYPQDDNVHIEKLTAFMNKYCHEFNTDIANNWQQLNLSFNQNCTDEIQQYWLSLQKHQRELQIHAKNWANTVINDADLASRLVQFIKKR